MTEGRPAAESPNRRLKIFGVKPYNHDIITMGISALIGRGGQRPGAHGGGIDGSACGRSVSDSGSEALWPGRDELTSAWHCASFGRMRESESGQGLCKWRVLGHTVSESCRPGAATRTPGSENYKAQLGWSREHRGSPAWIVIRSDLSSSSSYAHHVFRCQNRSHSA
jgi:hypothetical protein